MTKVKNYQCIIIGAGASGLFTAAELSKKGVSCCIIEHNKSIGKKIMISGGGRCNFTNIYSNKDHYVGEGRKFHQFALREYPSSEFINLIKEHKIPFVEKNHGELFCSSSAKEIINLFHKLIDVPATDLMLSKNITDIVKTESGFRVDLHDGVTLSAPNLVLATGGLSMPKIGASDFGHQLAKRFGHSINPLYPALVPFKLNSEEYASFMKLSGVSFKAMINVHKFKRLDDVLITHRGLSGPGILQASLYWDEGAEVHLDLLPDVNWEECLRQWQQKMSAKKISSLLVEHMPARLADFFLEYCEIDDKKVAEVGKKKLNKLGATLKRFTFIPVETEGYRKAEVTKGGVSTKDIDSKTMESKLVTGLFMVGEVVDVTGMLGGHNFQWAWSSSFVAAKEIAGRSN